MGINKALWHSRIGDLVEMAPVTTIVAAGCAGLLAGLTARWLIAR